MLEVYKSDVFGLQFEHSKKFLATKNQLCDQTIPYYDAQWSTCYGPHCPFLVVVWWLACHSYLEGYAGTKGHYRSW